MLRLDARGIDKSRHRASRAATLACRTLAGAALGRLRHGLAHDGESALLGDVAERAEVLDRLLARSVLLAANDATFVLHQVLLCQTARGVLGRSVEYLSFGAYGGDHGSICRRDFLWERAFSKTIVEWQLLEIVR